MTSEGLVIPSPPPLLVKDKDYAVDIARSIVWDADLDECSKHEIGPLGDSSFHDMMRVSLFIHPLALELSVCIGHPFTLIIR